MTAPTENDPALATRIALEAIVRQLCLAAVYNRTRMILAPHILYTRDSKLYVDAVGIEQEGQPPREEKLGTFKLDGLKELTLTGRPFTRSALFDPTLPKYEGETLMAIEL